MFGFILLPQHQNSCKFFFFRLFYFFICVCVFFVIVSLFLFVFFFTHRVQALSDRYKELRDVNLYHLHFEGAAPFIQPTHQQAFRDHSFFIGANVRKSVQEGRATYIPTFLSEIPLLFQRGIVPLDVSLINVSPPDKHGFCSLGTSVECTLGAIQASKVVIAQVNTRMPRVHGHGIIHISKLDYIVHCDDPLPQVEAEPITDQVMAIGKNIANLIENGSTLQMGIGSIPNAVLACLHDHERLGLHTEMFSDGIIDLVERGVITNEEKTNENKHISIFGFCLGSQRLYDFIDDNPFFEAHSIDIVNDPRRIASNPKMVAINSAIEVDLTGQVCADSIGSKMFSGVGGQVDFMRGAALSQGGKPIIAIPSVTAKGESKIVPTLKSGAGVVTTRAHVRHVV